MDPGFLKLLDDDEDDNGGPAAADVDAFAAVLKGELGGAAVQAAVANAVLRAGNGNTQLLQPQSSAATLPPGYNISKAVPAVPPSPLSVQQWNQLTLEQREWYQRRLSHQRLQQQEGQQQNSAVQQQAQQQPQQQQKSHQQQIQQTQQTQQTQQSNQQLPQHAETVSGTSGNKKAMSREGISFTALMPLLQPHLPPEQGQQLLALYQRFKRNEITREDFIRGARVIAGDTVLVQTIRQMQQKQQKLQQLQKQAQNQLQQQTQAQQSQPSPASKPHQSTQAQQLPPQLALAAVGVSPPENSKQQQQKVSQEPASALQKNLQQATQPSSNPQQEPAGTNVAEQKHPVGRSQAFLYQHTHVENKALSQGSQPQPHLPPPSLPQMQHQSTPAQQGDRHLNPGKGPLLSSKTTASKLTQQVRNETEKSRVSSQSAKQQLPSSPVPSVKAQPLGSIVNQPEGKGPVAANQPLQPFGHAGLLQQSGARAQAPGHIQLHSQPHMVPRVPGLVTSTTPPQPSPEAPASVQSPPEKPLTKYAKQKLRRQQKKEEERLKAQMDEERQKKAEDESLKQMQNTPTPIPPSTVTAGHQGLQPQYSAPLRLSSHSDNNNQLYKQDPGSLSQTLAHQGNKILAVPTASEDDSSGQQGQSLVPAVKQESSDLQSEEKSQSMEPPKLPSQVVQKSVEQVFFPQPYTMCHSNSHANDQRNGSELAVLFPGDSIALPAPTLAPNSVQKGGMPSMPSVPPVPVHTEMSGLQSESLTEEVASHQRASSTLTALHGKSASRVAVTASACAEFSLNHMSPSVSGARPGQNAQPASSIPAPATVKIPSKKAAAGQKKSADGLSAQQPPSKKQKISPGEPDQSIDQLNDVTAVSGVNLKEEEEQLLIGPKEESRTTEAMRKIVQEEEESLFLEGGALRTKVAVIATRYGVQGVSDDVGRCLSMSVEERLRSMLYRIIKLSKQRCDAEKERHKTIITSDVQRKILLIKRKAKERLDTKFAVESERLRKLNEKKDKGSLPEVEREELKARAQKAQQEEEDRLKANAANVAARAAVGADDMLLKWQMMAEQGRQRRRGSDSGAGEEGAANRGASGEAASTTLAVNILEKSDSSGGGSGNAKADSQPAPVPPVGSRPSALVAGTAPRLLSGRRLLSSKSTRRGRAITVRDVITFLETESQMSKSTLLYRLYERQHNGLSNNRK